MSTTKTFTELGAVSSATLNDIICAVQGYVPEVATGTSYQETLGQIFSLFLSNAILYNTGNPNSAIAGSTYQLCWDTVNSILYICTTTGTSSTAVWKKVITLSAGSGINISQSGNNITISSSATGLGWSSVSGPTMMAINSGYVTTSSFGVVALTLPTTSVVGDAIQVIGNGSSGWEIIYGAGQYIIIGSATSTVTSGSIASTNQYDALYLICTIANTAWQTVSGPQGDLTIV